MVARPIAHMISSSTVASGAKKEAARRSAFCPTCNDTGSGRKNRSGIEYVDDTLSFTDDGDRRMDLPALLAFLEYATISGPVSVGRLQPPAPLTEYRENGGDVWHWQQSDLAAQTAPIQQSDRPLGDASYYCSTKNGDLHALAGHAAILGAEDLDVLHISFDMHQSSTVVYEPSEIAFCLNCSGESRNYAGLRAHEVNDKGMRVSVLKAKPGYDLADDQRAQIAPLLKIREAAAKAKPETRWTPELMEQLIPTKPQVAPTETGFTMLPSLYPELSKPSAKSDRPGIAGYIRRGDDWVAVEPRTI